MNNAKNSIKKVTLLSLMIVICFSLLAGCGGPKNLEEAFEDESVQNQIKSLEGNGITITAEDNTLIYTYKYADTYDFSKDSVKKQVVSALKKGVAGAESTFKTVAEGLEKETELTGISVKVVYTDSKDKVLYDYTFDFSK